jgi:xanthine dehydrogenase accessory factor
VIVGYEAVAGALTRISKTLRFRVTVVDPLATAESAPEADEIVNELNLSTLPLRGEAFIVVATHGRFDEEALRQAVETSASYIALVASPKRGAVILEQLRDLGMTDEASARIKVPAGLDIGAEGAEEIALSILAEIVQLRRAGKLSREPVATKAPEPAEETDPICGMKVAVAGAMHTAEHGGRRYYFCCAHCRQTFEKDPHRYADVA